MVVLRSLQCVALLLALTHLVSSSAAAAAVTTTAAARGRYNYYSRKLLVAPVRTSPETASEGQQQQQEMDVSGWRTAAPFRRPGASLGRHVPGSHANPSHN